ncbi:MAG: phosphoenolpyruvate--protein phosphotransferase [Chloroflexi bacterium]|nr:MAG: phosphoenolpyruvate--protein phosphotransferase [Chloroflexota bacterium]TME03965.1 MAG: phosphoenolpyruvate--protein phosphotransferase [Chloroflexota bacterium]TME41098.1 MAG: phosphoenolpyruvate--protein phosphotransferase [Chloroflexota bacterium]
MGEVVLHGVSAAPGITMGYAVVLDGARNADAATLSVAQRAVEAQGAADALQLTASELERIAEDLREAGRDAEAEIVETGVLMALDPELSARVEALIVDLGVSAEVALREAADQTAAELARLPDPALALRADDVRSVGRRAAACVAGAARTVIEGVIVARTLGPADVAELAPKAKGIALAGGGVTAHAAIVARSLGLPMVVGLGAELLAIGDGEEVLVDGDRGIVVRGPDVGRISVARAEAERRRLAREAAVARRLEPAQTKDGHRVRVLANASTAAELREAMEQGAEGVGLLRSELLFLEAPAWPTFEEQVRVLRPVLSRLRGTTATVRLFDFGGDKTPPFLRGASARGIDLLLDAPQALQTQLAAIVEAGRETDLRILVPMVTSAEQMQAARGLLNEVLGGRRAQLGAMIETPEAAASAQAISAVAEFLSIGTNDLTQLVLGLDREQSKTAPVLDVRVLRLIAATSRAAHAAHIPVDVCGEAASEPGAMSVLVGLGVDELSVAAARVGVVRQWVREMRYATSRRQSQKLLDEAGHASRERV